jgi:DNA polymerase
MSLDGAGKALGLPEDKAKDKAGKQLIRWFAKPCKPTKTRPDQHWHDPIDYPEKWAEYKLYNAQDVEAERNIHNLLHAYEPTGDERRAWVMDQLINDRGVHIDM